MNGVVPEFETPISGSREVLAPLVSLNPSGGDASDGVSLSLNGEGWGYQLDESATGLTNINVDVVGADLPGGGSVYRHDRLESGEMFLPVHITSPIPSTMGGLFDRLVQTVMPGLGRRVDVNVFNPYTQETLTRSGVVSEVSDVSRRTESWWVVGLTIQFFDPFWYGRSRKINIKLGAVGKKYVSKAYGEVDESGQTSGSYEFPHTPIWVGESVIKGEETITVYGDAPVYWSARVTGPGNDFTIRNSEGQEFHIQGMIDQPVYIDSTLRQQSVRLADGTSIWERVPLGRDKLFPLHAGENTLQIEMVGASLQSEIVFSYREPFFHPLGGGIG